MSAANGNGDAIGPALPDEVPPTVARWLKESPPRRLSAKPPAELLEGVGFAIWGALLAVAFFYALAVGGPLITIARDWPNVAPVWLLAMALSGLGAWLAFWLASELSFGVSTEWKA